MYFPIAWPRLIDLSIPTNNCRIHQISCDRVKIIFAVITDNFLGLWYCKPLAPVAYHLRGNLSLEEYGSNRRLAWKPDSSMIAVTTNLGNVIIYTVETNSLSNGVFCQIDSPNINLKRDSAELLMQETIPSFTLKQNKIIAINARITSIVCFSLSQLLVATENAKLIRCNWNDELIDNTTIIHLETVTFTYNQQKNYNPGSPKIKTSSFVENLEYSPLIGGFSVTFNDGRAAFLTAPNLKFFPNEVQGLWAPGIEDATCCGVNHKFRLLAFGRKNSEVAVFGIDENTGGLELYYKIQLSSKDYAGNPGAVNELKWTPDGCAVILSWEKGGFSLWSTFGTMLMCSLVWDYGLNVNLQKNNPFNIYNMEWFAEGYQLIMLKRHTASQIQTNKFPAKLNSNVLQLDFTKSTLTINPGMSSNSHIMLQGEDKIYVSQGKSLDEIYFGTTFAFPNNGPEETYECFNGSSDEKLSNCSTSSILSENKHWAIIQLPLTYASTNWPVRYAAIDDQGNNLAVAGRTGFAHYSMLTKKWKLFGNQIQEKDFIVTAGLLWWRNFIIMGCFSLLDDTYELRIYPKETKLDNRYGKKVQVKAPVIIISLFKSQLVVFTADGIVTIFQITMTDQRTENEFDIKALYEIDIRSVCVHPACVVSLTISNLKNEMKSSFGDIHEDTLILNVSGRLLMIQRNSNSNLIIPSMSTCLASCVECFWLSHSERMRDCLWLFSGSHGMRVWLPVLPSEDEIKKPHRHTFMSKRIMLSFPLKLYPLIILFDDAIVLGVENDTILYSTDNSLHFSLPFNILNKKSQVYLHKILRQLIKRNLGYTAWEIARSCSNLPYFPHSLELLLHEVLEEEATSKDPIPDALLPSVLEFIKEFPVYLQTIVQCARKTEIALWPYLFSTAGKPKELFLQSLSLNQLDIAANYLIVLQNLEPSSISRQYATLLFDTALDNRKWELAKDLSRFLKAIDPCEVDSPRQQPMNVKISPPLHSHQTRHSQSNAEDLTFILGSTMARNRSFSAATMIAKHSSRDFLFRSPSNDEKQCDPNETTVIRKKSTHSQRDGAPPQSVEKSILNETFFIEVIIQRHARKLLETRKLKDLGYMSAILDFHLVGWLTQENNRSAKVDDFVSAINQLHYDLNWPKPQLLEIEEDILLGLTKPSDNRSNTSDSGYFSIAADGRSTAQSSNLHDIAEEPKDSIDISVNSSNASDAVYHQEKRSSDFSNNEKLLSNGIKSNKLEIQLRYLLQLFTEANCIDFSLILSILLLDAASIGRIINFVIRSESLSSCQQIRNALEQITKWSLNEQNGYKKFMISLQQQLMILDEYIVKQKIFHEQYFSANMPNNSFNKSTTKPRASISGGSNGVKDYKDNNSDGVNTVVKGKFGRARSVSESNSILYSNFMNKNQLNNNLVDNKKYSNDNEKSVNENYEINANDVDSNDNDIIERIEYKKQEKNLENSDNFCHIM